MIRPKYFIFFHKCIWERTTSEICSEIDDTCSSNDALLDDQECSLYIAPSSISGAGFGMFTTREVKSGENIIADLSTADAPNLVICDYEYSQYEIDWVHPSYVWDGSGFADFECESSAESVVTFGAFSNFHTYLANTKVSKYISYSAI